MNIETSNPETSLALQTLARTIRQGRAWDLVKIIGCGGFAILSAVCREWAVCAVSAVIALWSLWGLWESWSHYKEPLTPEALLNILAHNKSGEFAPVVFGVLTALPFIMWHEWRALVSSVVFWPLWVQQYYQNKQTSKDSLQRLQNRYVQQNTPAKSAEEKTKG